MWTEKVDESDVAQDPLGMNRVINRLLGDLLPGITTISPRARYISHHLWAAQDVIQNESPETRAEFFEGIYQRERLLMLASVEHAESEQAEERNHRNIVGRRTGTSIARGEEDPISLDFSFVSSRAGSYGRAYVGPLQEMGLLEASEEHPYLKPTERGSQIAEAYGTLVDSTGADEFIQRGTISRDELQALGPKLCLCSVCEDTTPDREPLRDIYLGRNPPVGGRTRARFRGRSLRLFLHLARLTDEQRSLTPDTLLNACYFGAIEHEGESISAEIPDHLTQHAAYWKVLRAHDYLRYASEAVLESWLSFLTEKQDETPTISGFKKAVRDPTIIEKIGTRIDEESINPDTPLSAVIERVWPESSAQSFLNGETISPVSIHHDNSEYVIDRAIRDALDNENWKKVHTHWPLLVITMATRFSNPAGPDQDAWNWMTSHTSSDLSPARFRAELRTHVDNGTTISGFIEWFIEQYVISHAQQVWQERAADSAQARGWFQPKGSGWEKVRDHSTSHWSARFGSALSVLRDLGLLHPDQDSTEVTAAGAAAIDEVNNSDDS